MLFFLLEIQIPVLISAFFTQLPEIYNNFPTPVKWYCIISLIFGICYFGYKIPSYYRKFKKVKRAFSDVAFKSDSSLSDEQKKAIATSAMYSAQQGAYVNAFETGLSKGEIKEILSNSWGIENTNDAIGTLTYLRDDGFQQSYHIVLEALEQKEKSHSEFIDEIVPDLELAEKLHGRVYNLKACLGELKDDKMIESGDDLKRLGVVGWDCGRLSFIARICHDAGYITEQDAWEYINEAYSIAKNTFTNWEDYSKSYVIGRAVWGGAAVGNSGMASIADDLLNKKPSPYEIGF